MNKSKFSTGRVNQKLKTREKILRAALDLLKNKVEFSLEDVAENMGSSRATVYRYFSNIDLLCAEAALSLHTKTTDELMKEVNNLNLSETLFHIQKYFNTLAQKHEVAFRKYLSVALAESAKGLKADKLRGSRRPIILEKTLAKHANEVDPLNQRNLQLITSVLSGIEPLVANKDVNGLSNKDSNDLLKWALEMIIRGMSPNQK